MIISFSQKDQSERPSWAEENAEDRFFIGHSNRKLGRLHLVFKSKRQNLTSLAWKWLWVRSSSTFQLSFNKILTFYISSKDRIRPKRMVKTNFCYDNLFKSYKRLHLVLESKSRNWRRKLKKVLSWFLLSFRRQLLLLVSITKRIRS